MGYGLVDAYAAVLETQQSGTIDFFNKSIVSDETVYARNINVQNVNVSNNAKLSLNALETIKILPPFRVYSGSKLELKIEQ